MGCRLSGNFLRHQHVSLWKILRLWNLLFLLFMSDKADNKRNTTTVLCNSSLPNPSTYMLHLPPHHLEAGFFLFILVLKDLMITGQKVNNTVVQSGRLGQKSKHAHPACLCLANRHRSFCCHFDCYKLTSCCSSLLLNCSSTRAVVKYRLVCSCLRNWSKQGLGCDL